MRSLPVQIDVNAGPSTPPRIPLTPEEIAKRKAAETGAVVGLWLAVGACLFAFIGFCGMAIFTFGLATSWGGALRMILLSFAITLAALLLPSVAAIIQRSFPKEAQFAMVAWYWVIAISFCGVAAGALATDENRSAWAPREWLPNVNVSERVALASSINEATITRLILLTLCAGMLPAAGIGLRWSVLTRAESYRLAYGEVCMSASAPATQAPVMENASMLTGEDIFSGWAINRLRPASLEAKGLPAALALMDYKETCELNGVAPMNDKKFFTLLTERAERSFGPEAKYKTDGGKIHYRGWALERDQGYVEGSTMDQIEGPR